MAPQDGFYISTGEPKPRQILILQCLSFQMQFKGFDLSQRNYFVQNKKGIYFSLTITTKLTAQVLHATVFFNEADTFPSNSMLVYWGVTEHSIYTQKLWFDAEEN